MNKLVAISIFGLLSFGFAAKSVGQSISSSQTKVIKNQVGSVFLKISATR